MVAVVAVVEVEVVAEAVGHLVVQGVDHLRAIHVVIAEVTEVV